MDIERLNRKLNHIFIFQFLALVAVGIYFLTRPAQVVTTTDRQIVYQGPQGIPGIGEQGERGARGLAGAFTRGNDGANGINGKDAEPCTTSQRENGDTIISCPDGSSSIIPKPKDGENGQDGRSIQFRTNPETCDVEYRYEGDRVWTTLVEQDCDAQN